MNNALEKLRSILTDNTGLALNQYGESTEKTPIVSAEIVTITQTAQALRNIISSCVSTLRFYPSTQLAAGNNSFIDHKVQAAALLQIGALRIQQGLPQRINKVWQLQTTLLNTVRNTTVVKQQHIAKIESLTAAIAEGDTLLQLAESQSTEFTTAQVNRFADQIKHLKKMLAMQQLALSQIDNTQAMAVDVLQDADDFLKINSLLWQQQVYARSETSDPATLDDLEAQVATQNLVNQRRKSFIQTCRKLFVFTLIVFFVAIVFLASFFSSPTLDKIIPLEQPAHPHSINYEDYMQAQHALVELDDKKNEGNKAPLEQMAIIKRDLAAANSAAISKEFKPSTQVRYAMEYAVYGAGLHSHDLQRQTTIRNIFSGLFSTVIMLFWLYMISRYVVNVAIASRLRKRQIQLTQPLSDFMTTS